MDKAFWLHPDWDKATAEGQPFWMFDPLPVKEKFDDSHLDWFTNRLPRYNAGATHDMIEAMRLVEDYPREKNNTFEHLRGINFSFNRGVDRALSNGFGHRLKSVRRGRIFVWEGQYPKDNEVRLQIDLTVTYKGLTDFIHEPGQFLAVFHLMVETIRNEVLVDFPDDVRVTAAHRGRWKDRKTKEKQVGLIFELICCAHPADSLLLAA